MPRHRQVRPDAHLDKSTLSMDEIATLAGLIGKTWKRFRRRALPGRIRQLLIELLLELRWFLIPEENLQAGDNLTRARNDIGGIAALFASLATRSASLELTSKASSVPPCCRLNREAAAFVPCESYMDVGQPDFEYMTDWEYGDTELHHVAVSSQSYLSYVVQPSQPSGVLELGVWPSCGRVDICGDSVYNNHIWMDGECDNFVSQLQHDDSSTKDGLSDLVDVAVVVQRGPPKLLDEQVATLKLEVASGCMDLHAAYSGLLENVMCS